MRGSRHNAAIGTGSAPRKNSSGATVLPETTPRLRATKAYSSSTQSVRRRVTDEKTGVMRMISAWALITPRKRGLTRARLAIARQKPAAPRAAPSSHSLSSQALISQPVRYWPAEKDWDPAPIRHRWPLRWPR